MPQIIQTKTLFEITTTTKLSKPLRTIDIASALLSPSEIESCKSLHFRIKIFDKVVFSGKEAVYRAILQIAEPNYISGGVIKAEKIPYFNWSQAKVLIGKKYSLTTFNYNGTKSKITGLILGSNVSDESEHLQQLRRIIKSITMKFPQVLFSWEKCVRTFACETAHLKELEASQ